MKRFAMAAFAAVVCLGLVSACSDNSGSCTNTVEQDADGLVGESSGLADGEPCDLDAQCQSRACATVSPVSPVGVCYGTEYADCYRVLVGTWATKACSAAGMATSLCDSSAGSDAEGRCFPPDVPSKDVGKYEYTCCETTLFE